MAVEAQGVTFEISDECPVCRLKVDPNKSSGIPESHIPGLEHFGDPGRIILYHPDCAPAYVDAYHEWLRQA